MARLFLSVLFALAGAAVVVAAQRSGEFRVDVALFAAVAVLCAGGNLLEVFAPGHYSFQINLAFFFWGAMLLPPWAMAVLAMLSFAPGWVVHRFRWYMTAFNVANYVLGGVAVHAIVSSSGALESLDLGGVAALLGAVASFVVLNHMLLLVVISLAQGSPLTGSLRDRLEGIPLDAALALTGTCLAVMWQTSAAIVLLLAGPMFLVYRALWLPLVEHKARTDPKTGLYNSEHLMKELSEALAFARRHTSDLSVVMVDIDNLRLVNNRYGHLAGDRLIRGVAEELKQAAGRNGVAARFGGEEFCLLLPDTGLGVARQIADALRDHVAAMRLESDDVPEGLRVTVSAGVAGYPSHGDTPNALLHAADTAVYEAKLGGRNRVRVPLSAGSREILDRQTAPEGLASAAERGAESEPGAALRAVDPGSAESRTPPSAAPPKAPAAPREDDGAALLRGLIPWYAALLCAAAIVIAMLSDPAQIAAKPAMFVMLVGSALALDFVRIDIFQRANISPASIASVALAMKFGPLGPLALEAAIATKRALKRERLVKWAWDFGALGVAGAVAAVTYQALPGDGAATLVAGGTLAGAAYYVVNMSLLSLVMGMSDGRGPLVQWREGLGWLGPHFAAFGALAGMLLLGEQKLGGYVAVLFGVPIAGLWVAQKQYLDRSRKSVEELRSNAEQLRGLLADREHLIRRMHRSYLSTITTLARSIEARDPYTGGHMDRVSSIANALATTLGFDEDDLRAVEVGAIVHDIGKIGIPDEILLKQAALTDREYSEMRQHTEIASYILADLDLPPIVKQMARSHHERYDGAGYPDGLVGEEIPLAARILTVADALDAMTSNRPYRQAMPLDVAVREIEREAGSQFCPVVVAALRDALERNRGFRSLIEGQHVAA